MATKTAVFTSSGNSSVRKERHNETVKQKATLRPSVAFPAHNHLTTTYKPSAWRLEALGAIYRVKVTHQLKLHRVCADKLDGVYVLLLQSYTLCEAGSVLNRLATLPAAHRDKQALPTTASFPTAPKQT